MKINVVNQKDNPLLKRKELNLEVETDASTPERQELIDKLSSQLNFKKELIVIENIYQKFGSKTCDVYVKVYDSKENLEATEPKPKEKKEKPAETKTASAEGAKPAEEKKEEAKEEPKKEEKAEKPEEKPEEKAKETTPPAPQPPAPEKPAGKPKEEVKENA